MNNGTPLGYMSQAALYELLDAGDIAKDGGPGMVAIYTEAQFKAALQSRLDNAAMMLRMLAQTISEIEPPHPMPTMPRRKK